MDSQYEKDVEECEEQDGTERKDDRKRKTRNQNEKKRRDQFNLLVNELMSLVSRGCDRKMDKSLVLRTTIDLLKKQKNVKTRISTVDQCKPSFLSNAEFCQIMLEAIDGFILAIDSNGRVIYVSENITAVLGHEPITMLNKPLLTYIHPSEHFEVDGHLQNAKLQSFGSDAAFAQCEPQIEFSSHFSRISHDSESSEEYEYCQVSGNSKTFNASPSGEPERCLVVIVQPMNPIFYKNVILVDKNNNEFVARLSLECKFLLLDHKASPIIGYLPFEVLGTCLYDYNHFDDLEELTKCHRKLLQYGAVTSGYYRFLTKGQQWVWLRTHYYISYNQWNSKPEFIVCANTAVSYNEVIAKRKTSVKLSDEEGSKSSAVHEVDLDENIASEVQRGKDSIPFQQSSLSDNDGLIQQLSLPTTDVPSAELHSSIACASNIFNGF